MRDAEPQLQGAGVKLGGSGRLAQLPQTAHIAGARDDPDEHPFVVEPGVRAVAPFQDDSELLGDALVHALFRFEGAS